MADYEHKINTGTLFTNRFKKEESHPDYTGKANINGEMKDLSMWYNEEKKYYYIKIQDPYVKKEQIVPVVGEIDEDGKININDIPF